MAGLGPAGRTLSTALGRVRFWEQNGSGEARSDGLRRGDRGCTWAVDLGKDRYLGCLASGARCSHRGGQGFKSSSPNTRKIGGKTITRRLTDAELAAWQPLFDNARNMRALLAELQDLTLQIIEASPPAQP
jgi:hypothetical protein